MPTFLITYDLVGADVSSTNYQHLREAIEAYGYYAEVQKSVWFVRAQATAEQVFDDLWQYMHPADRLLVVRAQREAAWKDVMGCDDWLHNNLSN
jgi:hypothetical protein